MGPFLDPLDCHFPFSGLDGEEEEEEEEEEESFGGNGRQNGK